MQDLIRSSDETISGYTAHQEEIACNAELVQKAQDGDKEAFSLLFMNTYRRMYTIVKAILPNDEDAYDALQNGYTKAYKYLGRLDPPEMFFPWLTKIMQNAAKDVYRQSQEYVADGEMQEIADRDVTPDAERRADIASVLSQMDPRRAEVLTLYYYDGMRLAEIAKLLDEPASTVRSRFKAAKKEILALLKTKDIDSSLYSGSVSAMITVALRSVIGTDLLSAVTAQQMLDGILGDGKLNKAAFRLVEQRRNRSVLHLASILLGVCAGVAAIVTLLALWLTGDGEDPTGGLPWQPAASTSSSTTTTLQNAAVVTGDGTSLLQTTTGTGNVPTMGPMLPPIWTTTTAFHGGSGTTGQTYRPTAGTTTKTATTGYPFITTQTTTTASGGVFVPDYRAGYANTVGNTGNNMLSNSGRIAKQDRWLYYSADNRLYKVKTDGTGHQMIVQWGYHNINVVGDWIYMSNGKELVRCRTDGSMMEKIRVDSDILCLQVVGDTLYYCEQRKIVKCKVSPDIPLDEMEHTAIKESSGYVTDEFRNFCIKGDYIIYYSWMEGTPPYVYVAAQSLSTGKSVSIIHGEWWTDALVEGNLVYATSDTSELICFDTATNTKKVVSSTIKKVPGFCYMLDGVIGYHTSTTAYGYPLTIATDGTSVSNHWPSDKVWLSDGYYTFDDGYVYTFTEDGTLCRAKPNGSEFQEIT